VAVPAGADAYVLKGVIHDWDDKEAIAILRTCRAAMSDGSKLINFARMPSGNANQSEQDPLRKFLGLITPSTDTSAFVGAAAPLGVIMA